MCIYQSIGEQNKILSLVLQYVLSLYVWCGDLIPVSENQV